MLVPFALLASIASFQSFAHPPDGTGALHWIDLDADGDVDALGIAADGGLVLLRQESDRRFVDASRECALGELRGVRSLVAADLDGDRRPDLVLGGADGLRLLHQTKAGTFEDASTGSGLEQAGDVLALERLDLEGDGGVDLHVVGASGHRLFRDAGDGVFVELDLGLARLLPSPLATATSAGTSEVEGLASPTKVSAKSERDASRSASPGAGAPASASNPNVAGASSSTPAAGSPAPPSAAMLGLAGCIKSISDEAMPGNCFEASSIPTLGLLHPLSVDFNIDDATGHVGMGTTAPSAGLHVASIDGVLATGTTGQGNIPVEGAGVRMMWYPKKAAFRAGRAQGNAWDDANVGMESIGLGNSAVATGQASVALGALCLASGTVSVAMGNTSTASGVASTAMGSGTTASGDYSTAMSHDTLAAAENSTAMGESTHATGFASTSMGESTLASGEAATSMGFGTLASGSLSTAMGDITIASGSASTAMGIQTRAEAYTSLALGRYNLGGGNQTTWVATDPLFEIGNGASNSTRANALTVLKNGNVGITTATPTSPLHVQSANSGAIVRAEATATSGTATGINASSTAPNGVGVQAFVSSVSGTPIALSATAPLNGYAGYFAGRSYATTLGVGVFDPPVPLQVDGGSDAAPTGGGDLVIGAVTGQNLAFDGNEIMARNNGATAGLSINADGGNVYISSNGTGRVGILTASPGFDLHVNGTAGKPGGGSWSVASDARLKRDVEDLDGALERLLELRGVSYEYRDPASIGELPGRHVGFIAQEVETVFPEWVGEKEDGMKYVTVTGFEALAVEALRELDARNERLAAENRDLRIELDSLRALHAQDESLRSDVDALLARVEALTSEVRQGEHR